MKKILRKVTVSLLLPAVVVTMWWSAGKSQDAERTKGVKLASTPIGSHPPNKTRDNPAEMTAEEKLVRDVYARLMRYQSAAVDELAKGGKPSDYLTFELRNIRSGNIADILDRSLVEMATPPGELVIALKQVHLGDRDGVSHAYYLAAWTAPPDNNKQPAIAVNDEPGAAGFDRYTVYQVKVWLQGRQISYRALVLSRLENTGKETKPARVEIFDNMISGMNTVYAEDSPRVQSPWNQYAKSELYLAVTRVIKATKAAGQPLIPADAPIGYLPGDDVSPTDDDRQTLAANTTCLPSVNFSDITAVGKDYTNTVNVTVNPAVPITLTLTTTSGTGSAVFTANNSTTLSINTTTAVEIKGITVSSTKENIRLRATRGTQNVETTDFTVIQVTISMRFGNNDTVSSDNAARSTYSGIIGTTSLGSFMSSGTGPRVWRNGVEFIGTILPSNFDESVILKRQVDAARLYLNQTPNGTEGPFDDTSDPTLRDDDPDSGDSVGRVFDLDAPGIGSTQMIAIGTIMRRRVNFHAWATVDNGVRVSPDFAWFSRESVIKQRRGDELQSDVNGDNTLGTGTTNLTWNLQ